MSYEMKETVAVPTRNDTNELSAKERIADLDRRITALEDRHHPPIMITVNGDMTEDLARRIKEAFEAQSQWSKAEGSLDVGLITLDCLEPGVVCDRTGKRYFFANAWASPIEAHGVLDAAAGFHARSRNARGLMPWVQVATLADLEASQ